MDELAALRRDIRQADRIILQQVARRLAAARRIGQVKQQRSLPLRNYDVEAEVIREARAQCKRLGLDQELGEDIMRKLIEAAVREQERRNGAGRRAK